MVLEGEAVETAMSAALRNQPKQISYPDYKTTEDFPLWLSGFEAKIRNAYGFKLDEYDKVKAEVIRGISGKLLVGSALDAYNRLHQDDKGDYDTLIEKLTEEFVDPNEKRNFGEKIDFNRRKRGQKLKDFMQEVVRDMNRYSPLPDQVRAAVGDQQIPNPEKEREGVRRFRAGIRTKSGKKCESLDAHMAYHLVEKDELNWKNAIKVASRWELAHDGNGSDGSSSASSDDEVKAS